MGVYVDCAATTFVLPEVRDAMLPFLSGGFESDFLDGAFANPSSSHRAGKLVREAVEQARKQVANAIGADSDEIFFTSGGSEADNLVLKGFARANKHKGRHIITTKIEHLAVLNSCQMLKNEGFEISYLDVDDKGRLDVNLLEKMIRPDTIMISVMYANNEIGTIEPIGEIAKIAKKHGVFFHTDAVQAVGNVHIDVKKLGVDALSLSAHKFYGPKGIGALYIKKGYEFSPIISGGHQEKNKRAGTENVPGIVGLGKAIQIASKNIDFHSEKLLNLRNYYISEVFKKIPNVKLNGDLKNRLPGNANISFEGVGGASLLLLLSEDGIFASSGSACTAGLSKPSHVLKAIGLSDDMANSAIRVTFGNHNTIYDVDYIVQKMAYHVENLRKMNHKM